MYEARQKAAYEVAVKAGAEVVLVLGIVSIRYLTGFTGSEAALILAEDETVLLCDSRYTLQASRETSNCRIEEYKTRIDGIADWLRKSAADRIAFDAEKMAVAFYNRLKALLTDVEFIPLSDQLDRLRAVKSEGEIRSVEESARLASDAFRQLLPLVRPGVSESFLALELEILMKRAGAEEKAFDFIVASGERGALPHGRPTDRLLSAGELVTFDFGARVDGYHSDETVTLAIGKPADRMLEIYGIVKDAHDLAIAGLKPGIGCRDVDAIARNHIVAAGYGEFFGHGLGHGVGLEIHEKPALSPRSEQTLEEGMIVTVEPGIYLPDVGGVRIESLLLVTADGCRVLGGVSKELVFC